LNAGERRYSGIVLNLSQGGLFVQTSADMPRGSCVDLELSAPGRSTAIPVRATVVWRRVVPHQLRSAAHGGLGVQIDRADESYYETVAGWLGVSVKPAGSGAAQAPTRSQAGRYRVRVGHVSGPRTRTLTLRAGSVEEARREALRSLGDGWRVMDVETL
jgi:Tfp pilus assembly protein PilZ